MINRLNNDELAWSKFFTRYRTAISDIGKCKGLTPVECDELVQLVMIRFHHKIQNGFRYDQTLARFRTFFCTIINGCIIDILRQRKHNVPLTEEEMGILVDNNSPDELMTLLFNEKWREILKKEALIELSNRVDEKTYQAFELYAIHNRPVAEIEALLGLTSNQIYVYKNRCQTILKEIISRLNTDDPELDLHE